MRFEFAAQTLIHPLFGGLAQKQQKTVRRDFNSDLPRAQILLQNRTIGKCVGIFIRRADIQGIRALAEILCTECGADGMIGAVDKCERALFTSTPKHGECIGTRSGKCRFPAAQCGIAAAESRKLHYKTAYFDILPSPRIGTPVKRVGKAHHSRLIAIVYARRLRH